MAWVVQRLEDAADRPDLFLYHLAFFYEMSFQYWFETKGQYSMPIYEALEHIRVSDAPYHSRLAVLFGNSLPHDKVDAGKELCRMLFER